MYAPLAHRLGLYAIKSELEDLSLRYRQPEQYSEIEQKLRKTKAVRTRFINSFAAPAREALEKEGLKFSVKGRPKSIASIWNKMQKQRVSLKTSTTSPSASFSIPRRSRRRVMRGAPTAW